MSTFSTATISITGDYVKQFSAFVGYLGALARQWEKSPPVVQNLAARIVADRYRHFLRQGVDPELSVMTKLLTGDHPPLSGLADHVIVRETTGDRGAKPAVVTFETGWARFAVMHDVGYILHATAQQRQALFLAIENVTGLSPDKWLGTSGIENQNGSWIIPARKHAHFLRSKELVEILSYVAKVLLGDSKSRAKGIAEIVKLSDERRPVPDMTWRPPLPSDAMKPLDGITAVAMKTTRVGTILRRRKS